jgi:predicted lipoprotein with Yx(FWY)xxD motif
MLRTSTLLAIATTALVALAGCGSSSTSTNTATTSSAGAGAAGPYGHGSAAATTASTTGTATVPASGTTVAIVTKHSKDGTILAAGTKKKTVYLFEKDAGTASTCNGPCEVAWPPVTTAAVATASGGATSSMLGTITRPDGTKQVTYNGHPLYFFEQDKDSGDAYGQGVNAFGASWYVLKPSGEKVDQS